LTPDARRRWNDEAGVIMVSTLTKLVVVLGLVGAAGFDTISIASTELSVRDHAQAAAQIGHQALHDKATPEAAYAAVVKYAKSNGDTVVAKGFSVGARETVTVTLRRDAATMLAKYLPGINDYVTAIATASATNPLP
jgi:2-keto-3-deoxy-galactonokinase